MSCIEKSDFSISQYALSTHLTADAAEKLFRFSNEAET